MRVNAIQAFEGIRINPQPKTLWQVVRSNGSVAFTGTRSECAAWVAKYRAEFNTTIVRKG